MKLLLVVVILFVMGSEAAKEKAIKVKDKDMMRKMIIYDKVKAKLKSSWAFNNKKAFSHLEKSQHVLLSSAEQDIEIILDR